MKKYYIKIIKEANFGFQIGFYLMNLIRLNLQLLFKILKLTQFYIIFSRQEHQIELLWGSINF